MEPILPLARPLGFLWRGIRFTVHRHNRGKGSSAKSFGSTFCRENIGGAYLQRFAGPHHARPRNQQFAVSWRDQVDLVFHREHRALRWHQRVGRIAASAIGNRCRNSRVKVPVLLSEFFPEGNANLAFSRTQRGQFRSEMLHQALSRETFANPPLEICVNRLVFWFGTHDSQFDAIVGETRAQSPILGVGRTLLRVFMFIKVARILDDRHLTIASLDFYLHLPAVR
jgi:hypothetical protein